MSADTLPAALQPWRSWLQWFEPDLAACAGALVQRLHPLLGRFHGGRHGGDAEPEGLDDLRSRGPYERLLPTEWLLADELPDEFLRRAAGGEHLFLAPRPRARRAERCIPAIFDAGPLQLGAPRLAHLALWILLARRAQQVGGELRWGVLQAPGTLHAAHAAKDLQQLLRSRSFEPGTEDHWARWRDALVTHTPPWSECWLIAPQAALPGWRDTLPSHRVQLRRGLQGDVLEVTVQERTAQRSLQLPLPEPAAAVPLLKGLFAAGAPGDLHQRHDLRLALTRAPLISPPGTHVAVPLLDEPGAVLFPIPRGADRKRGKPRRQRWAAGAQPLAVAFAGKQFGALVSDPTHLFFWQMHRFPAVPRPERERFDAPPGASSWLRAAWLRQWGHERLCVLDRSRRLVSWDAPLPKGPRGPEVDTAIRTIDTDVRGLAQWEDGQLVFAVRYAGWLWVRRLAAQGDASAVEPICETPDDPEVLFAGGRLWANGRRGACAVRLQATPQERWRIAEPVASLDRAASGGPAGQAIWFEHSDLTLPAGYHALGLVHDARSGRFALVARSPDARTLFLFGEQVNEPLYTTAAKLSACSVCPNTGLIAMLTADRQLVVYAVPDRAARLIVHGTGLEDADAPA